MCVCVCVCVCACMSDLVRVRRGMGDFFLSLPPSFWLFHRATKWSVVSILPSTGFCFWITWWQHKATLVFSFSAAQTLISYLLFLDCTLCHLVDSSVYLTKYAVSETVKIAYSVWSWLPKNIVGLLTYTFAKGCRHVACIYFTFLFHNVSSH